MPTYLYSCSAHGEFEFEHSVNDTLEICPKCQEENITTSEVKRLIARTNFVLNGGGWAREGYSK